MNIPPKDCVSFEPTKSDESALTVIVPSHISADSAINSLPVTDAFSEQQTADKGTFRWMTQKGYPSVLSFGHALLSREKAGEHRTCFCFRFRMKLTSDNSSDKSTQKGIHFQTVE